MKCFTRFGILVLGMIIGMNSLQAQHIFSEGFVAYDVYVADSNKPCGMFKQTIKSGNLHKEFSLNNGIRYITIHQVSTGNYYSLYKNQDQDLALQLSQSEYDSIMQHSITKSWTIGDQHSKILEKMGISITSKNGEQVVAKGFYTPSLVPQHDYFNPLFPKLPGLLLSYTSYDGEQKGYRFEVKEISESVVDQRMFNIPAKYAIIRLNDLGD